MERKLNKILAYLKPKNTPVLDIPTEEATDSKLVTSVSASMAQSRWPALFAI